MMNEVAVFSSANIVPGQDTANYYETMSEQESQMRDPIRITSFTRWLRSIRRLFSRNEWAVRLLGFPRDDRRPSEPGLILIQIDGLSQTELQRSIVNGRMPFLKSLMDKEQYVQHAFYSGLPSSTPSVQGELFYGVRTIVPAFGFRDHQTGQLVRMFAQDVARKIEESLRLSGPGLLQGGSSYSNNYGGGATDVHYCATSFGWSEFLKTVNPFRILVVLLLNLFIFARVTGLMLLELFLAAWDFVRGIARGREFWQELLMIPARVVVVVLLRELVTISACFDASRGQPIVHLNYLGYDEQAHRRGPSSRFAHWSLRAIDHCIRRIWTAAHQGAGREYDVWIFSDHGQEETRPYQNAHGTTIQQVVADLVDGSCEQAGCARPGLPPRLPSRASWLGAGRLVTMLFGEQDHDIQSRSPNVQTVTSGPLAFVYFLNDDAKRRRNSIAQELVERYAVPMAVVAEEESLPGARVYTKQGTFRLPDDAVQVFGAEYPFLDDIGQDMIALAGHADAGDILLVGWNADGSDPHRPSTRSTSFVLQNGAHAGPGVEECRGFALLPADIAVGQPAKRYIRPDDLRRAALRFMGREDRMPRFDSSGSPERQPIRILTYNVHACMGMDGLLSPDRIARVIAQSGASIVCLQELDVFRRRSGNRDQAEAIARCLEMQFQFHPAWHVREERFGNAILSRYPLRVVEGKGLHHHKADRSRRSAIWTELDFGQGQALQVINTHLSIYPIEQRIQATELMEEWVYPASLLGPVLLCGDFNARPNSRTCRIISRGLNSADRQVRNRPHSTYFSPYPVTRIDHIFVTRQIDVTKVRVLDTRLAKIASDHLPLAADLRIDDWSGKAVIIGDQLLQPGYLPGRSNATVG
jgi:endonuclease/exonuclease/phosphatase family metal-dependent hydrolase